MLHKHREMTFWEEVYKGPSHVVPGRRKYQNADINASLRFEVDYRNAEFRTESKPDSFFMQIYCKNCKEIALMEPCSRCTLEHRRNWYYTPYRRHHVQVARQDAMSCSILAQFQWWLYYSWTRLLPVFVSHWGYDIPVVIMCHLYRDFITQYNSVMKERDCPIRRHYIVPLTTDVKSYFRCIGVDLKYLQKILRAVRIFLERTGI